MPSNRRAQYAILAIALVASISFVTNEVLDEFVGFFTTKIKSSGNFQSLRWYNRVLNERFSPVERSRSLRLQAEASIITSMEGMALVHRSQDAALKVHYKKKGVKELSSNHSSSEIFDVSNVGFYIQVYMESPEYLGEMLTGIRRFFPISPIVLLSDRGFRYDELCIILNCTFVWAKKQINSDRSREPHTYNCKDQMERVLNAIELNKVQYIFWWETDARVLGPLLVTPTHDFMQMSSDHNHFRPGVKILVDELFPYLQGTVKGWTSTGGTLLDAKKVSEAISEKTLDGFYSSKLWKKLISGFSLGDQKADCCLVATAMVAGMTIGAWKDFGEIPRLPKDSKKTCVECIDKCQEENKYSESAQWVISHEQPAIDRCVSTRCGEGGYCPPILHGVKQSWGNCDLTGGRMYGWCDGTR